ncbi:bifunctional phosphopantothenoylcysteine decarboxylase/phosphopantothenate--cysteine ligase CoaBC [Ilyobacter polytropus]|uniref:Coenzyme A biosynthesis bifunctional protein CoaBC n=1 Tax=Ilyobacter polytropus (strain ATCC 51220 / DSM 2926 / LMG 16218 / CuHBu1) TaxID=572544 RepID=E3H7Z9_ILYPC|nr:bifunctional phosphopantothenoylcysteine decarboxylase/phosphopantothenate--cysteine ligase CoaBC [Ilyobacter polytropus]ADO82951.1 Phosphopantothenoylcysteine decarboxylase; Phosphopantothenate-cysteine ligase [Ilyobacter polytropus DSM 2926]
MKKNVLLGVTGGIAAYKAANIISLLKKNGCNVRVIMTKSATEIITPLTLETLARDRVIVDMWEKKPNLEVEHISFGEWADVVLVAPATYNMVGKVANGIADDMLSTVISATKAPVYFALAMNVNMYENPILKDNIDKLKKYGYKFIEADEGFLACNVNAKGRLKKEEDIVNIIKTELNPIEKSLNNKKILITAGRTEEAVDPVRYLSNRSTGQMGYSLASAAAQLGAEVTLVSGPTNLSVPEGVKNFLQVRSAQEMFDTVMEYYDSQDAAIACAAVADYKVKEYSTHKIKKKDDDMVLVLDRNPDILYEMGQKKNKQFLIGFAAESENLIENATRKLQKKNLDLIVGNLVTYMQSSNNQVTLLKKDGSKIEIPEMKKQELAFNILKEIKF